MQAHDRGEGALAVLAERFGVSAAWAWKISAQRTRTGKMERAPGQAPGPKSRVEREVLARLLRGQPDATLAELQAGLHERSGHRFTVPHLWKVVRRMGFRLKKSRSTPKSAARKKTGSSGKSSWKRSGRSRRRS